jgi:hypothetical protein
LYIEPSSDWNLLDSTHISLSKTVYIPHVQTSIFQSNLHHIIEHSHISPFFITLETSFLLRNEEENCLFLALHITENKSILHSLVHYVDSLLIKLNLPTFYNPPIFHCSYAWRLISKKKMKSSHPSIYPLFPIRQLVKEINYRIGHHHSSISLDSTTINS